MSGRSLYYDFLLDGMSLFFVGFVFIVFALVILYSDDCIFGNFNISLLVILVSIFVVSIMFCLCLYYNIT